jgi:trehalose 6-phosphate phosphatase
VTSGHPPDLLAHRENLAHLMERGPAGLFLDIDGTLADLIDDPDVVQLTVVVQTALLALSGQLTVVVLTGREVAAAQRIVGLDSVVYVGNHGAEWRDGKSTTILPSAQPYVAKVHEVAEQLEHDLLPLPGVFLEEKGLTLSVHYRRSPDSPAARAEVLAFLAKVTAGTDLLVFEGKMVAEVRPSVPISKGTALEALVSSKKLFAIAAFGDDRTDADALRAVRKLRDEGKVEGMAVAVSPANAPQELVDAADYTLEGPEAMEELLVWLVSRLAR